MSSFSPAKLGEDPLRLPVSSQKYIQDLRPDMRHHGKDQHESLCKPEASLLDKRAEERSASVFRRLKLEYITVLTLFTGVQSGAGLQFLYNPRQLLLNILRLICWIVFIFLFISLHI